MDATAAAVQNAGVGRYSRELLRELVQLPEDDQYLLVSASSEEKARRLLGDLPPGAWRELRRLPVAERLTTGFWHRLRVPLPVDAVAGPFDVFHGPDFVVPPSRKPSVVTIHDLSFIVASEYSEPSLAAYLRSAVPRSLRRASQIITVSASVAAELVEAYPFTEARVRAIPNGVRPPTSASRHHVPDGPPTILIVGTIEPRKNLTTLLDAMPYVWRELPDARLVVAGRVGWRSERIMEKLREACRTSGVTFVDQPPDIQLARLFEEASLFVYPSAYEGFGLPVLEAMAHGLPVIASDIASLRETAGDAARFVGAFDASALAGEIVQLLNDRQLCMEMVQSGRAQVERHSWAETARRTRLAYQAAVDGEMR